MERSCNRHGGGCCTVITTPRYMLHLCADKATDYMVEAASEESMVFSLYFLQLPNNSELKQQLLGLFWQL